MFARKIFLFFTLSIVVHLCYAQEIEIKKVFGGYKLSQDGRPLTIKSLSPILEVNSEAFAIYKKAKSSAAVSNVIGAIGGGLIGWPIGTAIAGGNANWVLAGIGAGIILVSIPIQIGSNKKLKQSVDMYNTGFKRLGKNDIKKVEYELGITGNGAGLMVKF